MARGGSKRVPRKNTRLFFGLPMLAWPLRAMLSSGIFSRVIASTDDPEIASIARSEGAEVPFVRPADLAGDFTSTFDVVNHAVRHMKDGGEEFDKICSVYGTSVFLTPELLVKSAGMLDVPDVETVFAATAFEHPVQRGFILRDGLAHFPRREAMRERTQDLVPHYHDVGAFYWYKSEIFISAGKDRHSHFSDFKSNPVILSRREVADIDSEEDLLEAELRFRLLNRDAECTLRFTNKNRETDFGEITCPCLV